MKQRATPLSSLPLLLAGTAISAAVLSALIFPGSRYVMQTSTSIVTNFYLLGGLMLLLLLTSAAQGFLWIRLIWGPAVAAELTTPEDEEENDLKNVRAMRVTGTKKIAVLVVSLALNTTVFNYLGNGVFITDTKAVRVLTLLRSTDGQDRADAVHDAIILVGDPRIAKALKRVMDAPGQSREWAAYAAGIRNDKEVSESLARLLSTGNERERAAAAVALARIGDDRLIGLAQTAYAEMGKMRGDLIKALGMLGRRESTSKGDLEAAGKFLVSLLDTPDLDKETRRLVIWAIGRFNAPEGLHSIERLLESGTDAATMCTGLEAIGRIGAASSSPKLLEAMRTFDKAVQCPETVYKDFTGHEILVTERMNIMERLLREVARIGDRRAKPEMERLAKDESASPTVRALAAEIAFQMKYKRVDTEGR